MPCRDGGYSDVVVEYRDNPKIAAALCAVFTVLEKEKQLDKVLANVDWKEAGVPPKYISAWWDKHKIADEMRRTREKREQEKKRKRDAVLQKLTLEERKLLGV